MHNEKTQVSSFKIASCMIAMGGSFVKALGSALLNADSENRAKIQATWPDYWEEYSQMVILKEARDQQEEV